eukprot:3688669-Rhodomonas_salina.1
MERDNCSEPRDSDADSGHDRGGMQLGSLGGDSLSISSNQSSSDCNRMQSQSNALLRWTSLLNA